MIFWCVSGLIALTVAFAAARQTLLDHGFSFGLAHGVTIASSLLDISVGPPDRLPPDQPPRPGSPHPGVAGLYGGGGGALRLISGSNRWARWSRPTGHCADAVLSCPAGRSMNPNCSDAGFWPDDGIILGDGVCVLCSGWMRFVLKRDRQRLFRFTPIQSDYGRALALGLGINSTTSIPMRWCGQGGLSAPGRCAARGIAARLELGGGAASCAVAATRSGLSSIARSRYRIWGRNTVCDLGGERYADRHCAEGLTAPGAWPAPDVRCRTRIPHSVGRFWGTADGGRGAATAQFGFSVPLSALQHLQRLLHRHAGLSAVRGRRQRCRYRRHCGALHVSAHLERGAVAAG